MQAFLFSSFLLSWNRSVSMTDALLTRNEQYEQSSRVLGMTHPVTDFSYHTKLLQPFKVSKSINLRQPQPNAVIPWGCPRSLNYDLPTEPKALQKTKEPSGAPNDSFIRNSLKTLFRLSRVLLERQKCILKFGSVRSSQGNLSLEVTRASLLFSRTL